MFSAAGDGVTDATYLAPCEAVWHIFSFDIHYAYPSVMKLNFHLPNQHSVTLRDSECLSALLEREGINGLLPCSDQLEGLLIAVIPKGKRADIAQACINHLALWKHCNIFTITRSMRVNEYYANGEIDTRKQDFNQWVLAVGDGKLPIVSETYPNFIKRQRDDAYLRERAILTPRNDDADAINAYMFDKLEGESVTYNSADEICKASIDTLDQQHLYPRLNLKKGTPHHAIKES
ncbi:ATP-dependent DNA helicase PIF1-like protein [Tanacetum coccineum]